MKHNTPKRMTTKPDMRKPLDLQLEHSTRPPHTGTTPGKTWLHGGDPSEKPGYIKGLQGAKKPKARKWY